MVIFNVTTFFAGIASEIICPFTFNPYVSRLGFSSIVTTPACLIAALTLTAATCDDVVGLKSLTINDLPASAFLIALNCTLDGDTRMNPASSGKSPSPDFFLLDFAIGVPVFLAGELCAGSIGNENFSAA